MMTAFVMTAVAPKAAALSLIHDGEIEEALRDWMMPLLRAADLEARQFNIYIVDDPQPNAFVAGGQNIFVNSGLITYADNLSQLLGVLAHETGHIAGGHIAQFDELQQNATQQIGIAALLGLGVGLAGGGGGGAFAALLGGQQVVERKFLAEIRTREAAADEASVRYLDAIGISPLGIREFMKKLDSLRQLSDAPPSPYMVTHPITRSRLEVMTAKTRLSDKPPSLSKAENIRFARVRAKVTAFMLTPIERVFIAYPPADHSFAARYARSIAFFRRGQVDKSLKVLDELRQQNPEDAFLLELKGYVLFKSGDTANAVALFRRAAAAKPNNPSLITELAMAELESGDPKLLETTVRRLINVVKSDDKGTSRTMAWWLLAAAYDKQAKQGNALLARAEWYLSLGNKDMATTIATEAAKRLPPSTPAWRRAKSITALYKKS